MRVTFGSLMASILRTEIESRRGKIHTLPNCWRVSGRHVVGCPTPEDGPKGPFAIWDKGASVPSRVCAKCKYHEKRTRGKNYATCAKLRELREDGKTAAGIAVELLQNAAAQATAMLDGTHHGAGKGQG